MKTTRILIITVMLSMVASLFVACGNNEEKKKSGLSVYYVSKVKIQLQLNNIT